MSSATDGELSAAICHAAGDNYAVDSVHDLAYYCHGVNDRETCLAVLVLAVGGNVDAVVVNNVYFRTESNCQVQAQ